MQCRLHELRHKRRISVAAASKILANLVYSYKGMGLSMGTMCAGVTPTEGPALYYIDSDGTRLAGNLFCVGSGQTFAYGVLDAEYSYDMSEEDALELGKRSILAATHRDAFSGGYINLYHVKESGWVKHGFMDTSKCCLGCEILMRRMLIIHRTLLLQCEREGRVLQRADEAGIGWNRGRPRALKKRRYLRPQEPHCRFTGSCDTSFRSIACGTFVWKLTIAIHIFLSTSTLRRRRCNRHLDGSTGALSPTVDPRLLVSTPTAI